MLINTNNYYYSINIEFEFFDIKLNKKVISRRNYKIVTKNNDDRALELVRKLCEFRINNSILKKDFIYIGSAIIEKHKVLTDGYII